MRGLSTPRGADWHKYGRAGDATLVSVTAPAVPSGVSNYITEISASFDSTDTAQLDLYGPIAHVFDATSTSRVNLTTNVFDVPGYTPADTNKVIYFSWDGTAITGLTSGTVYFVRDTSGTTFKLAATSGGAAIDVSGTQAGFGTQMILPLAKSWMVYNHIEVNPASPIKCDASAPVYLKITPSAGIQAIVNMSGYAI